MSLCALWIGLVTLGGKWDRSSALATARREDTFALQNSYFRLVGSGANWTRIDVDPRGHGRFWPSRWRVLRLGDVTGEAPPEEYGNGGVWEYESGKDRAGNQEPTLTLRRLRFRHAHSSLSSSLTGSDWVTPGHTLAQRLTVEANFCGVRLRPLVPGGDGAVRLGVQAADGREIAAADCEVRHHEPLTLTFPPQPAGSYQLVLHGLRGKVGWYGVYTPGKTDGGCSVDGQPQPDQDLEVTWLTEHRADWRVSLSGNRLRSEITGPEAPLAAVQLVLPWRRDGYEVDDPQTYLFRRVYTSLGQYFPVEHFKRQTEVPFTVYDGHLDWLHLSGTNGYDLRVRDFLYPAPVRCEADQLVWTFLGPRVTMELRPATERLPDYYPVFYSSDPDFDRWLHRFHLERAYGFLAAGPPGSWTELIAPIIVWADTPYREVFFRRLVPAQEMDPDGFVWSWPGRRDWPLPPDDPQKPIDKRHFDQIPHYIAGSARYYFWTRDRRYLQELLPRLRSAMAYQLNVLDGRSGLLTIPFEWHGGTAQDYPSNNWDCLPFGYQDAICNVYFYASLKALAELEYAAGERRRGDELMALQARVRERFNETFWDDEAGRYVGCVDRNGERHDYGFTVVNFEAMSFGLASAEQARRIYHWLETDPSDAYHFRFSARLNTLDNQDWWYLGGKSQFPPPPFGSAIQNGGALLYYAGHDLIARARFLGPDNAFARLQEMLARYAEPDKLCGGNPLYHGEIDGWQVGCSQPYPEAGFAPASFLYAFLGIEADHEGLTIAPCLPSALSFAGVRNLSFAGGKWDVRVERERVILTGPAEGAAQWDCPGARQTPLRGGRVRLVKPVQANGKMRLVDLAGPVVGKGLCGGT